MGNIHITISVCVFLILFIVFMPFERLLPKSNLKKLIDHINDQDDERSYLSAVGIFEKLFNFSERFYGLIKNRMKYETFKKYSEYLQISGLDKRVTVEGVIASKFVLAFMAFVYIFLFGLLARALGLVFLGPILGGLGFVLPDLFVRNQMKMRQLNIEKELPGVLNTMAIMTEAGLGLFESIEKVCEVRNGDFVDELKKVSEEVKMGILRRDAFLRMSERCQVTEISTFVSALVQVLEKGASGISIFIKDQAQEIWEKRLNKAKELGAKASLKLFFPMLLLVMPASLIFLAGPIILQVIQDFVK